MHTPGEGLTPPRAVVDLDHTPFFPQQQYQCGPAAVATVLAESGVDVGPAQLTSRLYLPGREGTLQVEILATIRHFERIPYLIQSQPAALFTELLGGRPVLVLQDLGFVGYPRYHYAVVVGTTREGEVILRSGTTKREVMDFADFYRTWQRAEFWGVVTLDAGELPEDRDLDRYLLAVIDIEEAGNTRLAERGYAAALRREPNNETALFGRANSLYGLGRYREATALYADLIRQNRKNVPALNNLAESLAAQGCSDEALLFLDKVLAEDNSFIDGNELLRRTQRQIFTRASDVTRKSVSCSELLTEIEQLL